MKKWLKWISIGAGVMFGGFLLLMFQPWVFLPHQRIEISLPFPPEADNYTYLIPLGEKIEHNASNGTPDGHPGLDFGWNRETKVLAVADGTITGISETDGKITVTEQLGLFYRTVYQEMNSVEPGLRRFSKVKKGQTIGRSGHERNGNERPKETDPSGQIHWDFSSSSMAIDRLCPLNYFDAESKARIEKIWANVPANDKFKKEYPNICNGMFEGKEEK